MYGTIVPGCVRLTVRGWIAAESEVLRLDERVRAAFDAETTSKCAVLSGPISVCEMTSARRKSGRVDADGGIIQRTRECESHAPIDCPIFASAREEVTIRDLNMFPERRASFDFFQNTWIAKSPTATSRAMIRRPSIRSRIHPRASSIM